VLRELGSRNGTFVDGQRLEVGTAMLLVVGSRMSFGSVADGVVVVDASALAVSSRGGFCQSKDGLLSIPDTENPEFTVFRDVRGLWVCEEVDRDLRPIADGQQLSATGETWTVRLPEMREGMATVDAGPRLDALKLRLAVSRDGEPVQVTVIHRGREMPLEPRERGYVLLTLARARLADEALPLAEQGWLDRQQLQKMVALDSHARNVAIFRARRQVSAADVEGAAGVVEVRRGQRRLGIGPERLYLTRQ
jgi:hypothetical protein